MDLPRGFSIREGGSRILNPFDEHKLATLGRALRLPAGSRFVDLACGRGEMLCTWARDLGYTGLGGHAQTLDDFAELTSLLDHFADLDYELVEVVMADEHSWDRYAASRWLAIRRWLEANPDDELHGELRTELEASPRQHLLHQRSHLGWGVFVLMRRRQPFRTTAASRWTGERSPGRRAGSAASPNRASSTR